MADQAGQEPKIDLACPPQDAEEVKEAWVGYDILKGERVYVGHPDAVAILKKLGGWAADHRCVIV
ncbi:MAG TPA: hypothetical protein VGR71_04915, partial [Nitrospira sp.]|nr:hypothetical protein [Nitrospira sp.]